MKNLIKKLHYLFFALPLLVFLANCGSDDEPNIGSNNDLIGTWTVSNAEIDFDVNGQGISEFLIASGVPADSVQALVDLFETDFSEGFTGTIEFRSDNTYNSDFSDDMESGTWTLIGSALTIDPDTDDPVVSQVITLNSSTLIINLTETETDDFDGDGADDTVTINSTLTLNK